MTYLALRNALVRDNHADAIWHGRFRSRDAHIAIRHLERTGRVVRQGPIEDCRLFFAPSVVGDVAALHVFPGLAYLGR